MASAAGKHIALWIGWHKVHLTPWLSLLLRSSNLDLHFKDDRPSQNTAATSISRENRREFGGRQLFLQATPSSAETQRKSQRLFFFCYIYSLRKNH